MQLGNEITGVPYGFKGTAVEDIKRMALEYRNAIALKVDVAEIERKQNLLDYHLAQDSLTICSMLAQWLLPARIRKYAVHIRRYDRAVVMFALHLYRCGRRTNRLVMLHTSSGPATGFSFTIARNDSHCGIREKPRLSDSGCPLPPPGTLLRAPNQRFAQCLPWPDRRNSVDL
jgi:hypothetical protein